MSMESFFSDYDMYFYELYLKDNNNVMIKIPVLIKNF